MNKTWLQQSSNHPEKAKTNAEIPFAQKTIEEYRNFEKLAKNPEKEVRNYAEEKIDGAVLKWMNKVSETFSKLVPESIKEIGDKILDFFGIKEWFHKKISSISTWLAWSIGGILGIDLLKNKVDQIGEIAKQGKEMFFTFLEWLSFGGLEKHIDKIKEFVKNIDFTKIKKALTNPKEVLAEIKKQVSEEFPEVGYFFSIKEAEKAKNNEDKINLRQIAMFNFAIGHFSDKPELVRKIKSLRTKVKKEGYESLTRQDWKSLEVELMKHGYKELDNHNWIYYFEEAKWWTDKFILGYEPNQEAEILAKRDITKLAISNAFVQNAGQWIEDLKNNLKPFLENLPEEIKTHFEEPDFFSIAWYSALFESLEAESIPYMLKNWSLSLWNGTVWYTFEWLWAAFDAIVNLASIPFADDKIESSKDAAIEYGKACVPLMVMGGAVGAGKAIIMAPPRVAKDLARGNYAFLGTLGKTGMDITKGAVVYWLGAPITVTKKMVNASILIWKWQEALKHIPDTIKYNLSEFKHHYWEAPQDAVKWVFGLKHKEELLYEDLLHYKKLRAYYLQRSQDRIMKKGADKALKEVNKEISAIQDILDKRELKKHLSWFETLLKEKVKTIEGNLQLEDSFVEFMKKKGIWKYATEENMEDIRNNWYKREALEQLRKEWKISRTKEVIAYKDYLIAKINRKITAFKNFWRKSKVLFEKTASGKIFSESYEKGKEKLKSAGDRIKKKTAIIHENNLARPEQKQTFSERSREVSLEVNRKLDKLWESTDTAYRNLVDAVASGNQTKIKAAEAAVEANKSKIKEAVKKYKGEHIDAFKTRPIGHFTRITLKGATTLFVGMETARIIELLRNGEKRSAIESGLDLTARLAPVTGTFLDGKDAIKHFKNWKIWEGFVSTGFAVLGGITDVLMFTGIGTAIGAWGRAGIVSLKAGRLAAKGTKAAKVAGRSKRAKQWVETGIETTKRFLTPKKAAALAASGVGGLALYFSEHIEENIEEIN